MYDICARKKFFETWYTCSFLGIIAWQLAEYPHTLAPRLPTGPTGPLWPNGPVVPVMPGSPGGPTGPSGPGMPCKTAKSLISFQFDLRILKRQMVTYWMSPGHAVFSTFQNKTLSNGYTTDTTIQAFAGVNAKGIQRITPRRICGALSGGHVLMWNSSFEYPTQFVTVSGLGTVYLWQLRHLQVRHSS